ncbi:MAG: sigma-54-dependent Fis family transcriptional regulator [Bacteroidales bacterium]|nr:sigma-54-dependent Fis family transcriptional regulator [Bacteroidales bacterium]
MAQYSPFIYQSILEFKMSFTILIVEDEENARLFFGEYLKNQGYEVLGVGTYAEARVAVSNGEADIVLLDVQLPDGYGPNLLEDAAFLPIRPPVIIMTAYGDIDMAVEAMKSGAHDFLTKPVDFERLDKTLRRAVETVKMRRELAHYRQEMQHKAENVIGNSVAFKTIVGQANRVAKASVSTLLTGETGTGKEILARLIHRMGPRAKKPFVAINCGAIQSTVLETELFGYEKGAFTDATQRKIGLMQVADDGVLFLDELSAMSMDIQAKLLRALEDQTFRRVGGTSEIKVDVQIVGASNRDFKTMIDEGAFREDLYYRMKVVDLNLPPLRERKEDIPDFIGFFIRENNLRMGMNVVEATPKATKALIDYSWPGNIRELKNAIERAMLFCDDEYIDVNHLPREVAEVLN